MSKPTGVWVDVATGETVVREMTDEEYAALLESGWTPGEEDTSE